MSALRRVGCVAVFLLATLLVVPAPAAAQSQEGHAFIELHPGTIQAGLQVEIRASCGDDSKPAKIRSRAFDEITVIPQQGTLTAIITIPAHIRADDYRVDLRCDDGGRARADLIVLDMKRPNRGPETGGGGTAAADYPRTGPFLLAGVGAATLAAAGLLLRRWRRAG